MNRIIELGCNCGISLSATIDNLLPIPDVIVFL